MPRLVRTVTDPYKIRQRAGSYRIRRPFVWIDPYPEIPGTLPEKMVYAALTRRRIPFQFQEWFHVDLADLVINSWYRPDFMIPELKIIIQVQGAYWHSQPDRIESDSFIAALFEMSGWTVLFWWDYDIYDHLDTLIAQTPAINQASTGEPIPHSGRWYNDLAGLRTSNIKRRKPWTKPPTHEKIRRRKKTVKPAYAKTRGIF